MKRTDIINHLVNVRKYKKYLEIGVQDYYSNCDKIQAELKHGVDPAPRNKCDYIMTSDEFFKQLDPQFKYDIIFIDGLHLTEQVDKDILNSLQHLEEGGIIVMHDCHPTREVLQMREDNGVEWTGDVWKSIAKIRMTRSDLQVEVVDTDFGCGLVQRSQNQPILAPFELTWDYYKDHQQEILNLISPANFLKKYS